MDTWRDYHLLDSHGCRFDEGQRTLRTEGKKGSHSSSTGRGDRFPPPSSTDPSAYSVGLAALSSFPRREPAMTLQLFGEGWGDKVELEVRHPLSTTYPEWTPDGLPAVLTDGDVTVRLTEITGRLNRWDSNGFEERHQQLDPRFEILQDGRRTDEWAPGDLQLSDATGNTAPSWDARLCTREKAWKLRARFWRKAGARFAPEEIWETAQVPVPRSGSIRPLSGSGEVQGVKLELLAIADRGSYRYKNGVPSKHETPLREDYSDINLSTGGSFTSRANGITETDNHVEAGLPHVGVRAEGLREDQHLDLLAIDEQGRRIASERQGSNDNERYFTLKLPKDARMLTLRFLVHRCRTAEFLIQPPAFRERGS